MSAAPAKVPEWVDTARLCFEVCISEATVDTWVRQGILPPPVYRGGKRLWRWREVDSHLAGTTPTGAPSPYEQVENIRVVQQKTKLDLWVPLMFELKDHIRRWERKPGHIIRKTSDEPYTRPQISWAWWHERQMNEKLAGFEDYTLHGLRSTACVRLRKKGLSALQIASMIGMSEPMVVRYTRLADQREMALSAARQTEAGTSKVHRLQKQRNSNT